MNVKSITSKLDFLENLIVEMNPVNLEELKTLCLEKISEIQFEVQICERATFIAKHTTLSIDLAAHLAKMERTHFETVGYEIDVMCLIGTPPTIGMIGGLSHLISVTDRFVPKIGEEIKIEFEKPKVVYDKPESKYFTKPKNNFKKR